MPDFVTSLVSSLQAVNPWLLLLLFLAPFVATLVLVPWLVLRLPADYFLQEQRQPMLWGARHPVLRLLVRILKNLLGLAVMLMGLAMLLLPGQGILSIVLGFLLLEFPGKFRMERWLVSRPPVLHAVNWLRTRRGREPIRV